MIVTSIHSITFIARSKITSQQCTSFTLCSSWLCTRDSNRNIRLHYIVILSKSYKVPKLISNLHNRAKNKSGSISEKRAATVFKTRLTLKERSKAFKCAVGVKMQLEVWGRLFTFNFVLLQD